MNEKKPLSKVFLCYLQEFMHHVGLYMAKQRGAKIASEVSFDAPKKL